MVTYNVSITAEGFGTVSLGSMLDQLSLTSGSPDGIEQPNPSTLSISFLGSPSVTGTTYPASWWLGKAITVTIDMDDAGDNIVWRGLVSGCGIESVTADGATILVSLTAYSRMQLLSNQNINLDGSGGIAQNTRIAAVNAAAQAIRWDEMDGTTNWSLLGSTLTWANFDTIRPYDSVTYQGVVSSPMSITVPFYYAGNSDALSYFQLFATSCNAWFYESATNAWSMNWQRWRSAGSPAGTAIDLSTIAQAQSLRADLDVSRLANEITLTPYDPALSLYPMTVGDIDSIQQYGYRPQSYDIENYAYIDMANNVLYRYSQPYTNLTSIDIVCDLVPAAERINFMFSGANKRYAFTGIPATFGGNDEYEIRGCQLNLTYESATSTITVVPSKFWAQITAWWRADSNPWSSYATAITKWQDIV